MAASVFPVLKYDDAHKAIEYLVDTFGMERHEVHETPDGKVAHAVLGWRGDAVMLSSKGAGDPMFELSPVCVYLVCDDVDALHARAVAAGADICYPLTDQDYGSRDFSARDAEGNIWSFGTYAPGA